MSTDLVLVAVLPLMSVTVAVIVCGLSSRSGKARLWPSQVSQTLRLRVLLHCQGALVCSSSELLSLPSTTKRACLIR